MFTKFRPCCRRVAPSREISGQNIKSSADKSDNRGNQEDFSEFDEKNIQHLDFNDPSVLERIKLSPFPTFDNIDVKEERFEYKKLYYKLLASHAACEDHRERFFLLSKKIMKAQFAGTDN